MKSAIWATLALTVLGMQPERDRSVAVTGGQVRGASLAQGGAVFKGIPYAAPPVGDLRWREPQPVKAWSGVRDATTFGPICAQPPTIIEPKAAELSKEDCLYLNVWTPEWPAKARKAVPAAAISPVAATPMSSTARI